MGYPPLGRLDGAGFHKETETQHIVHQPDGEARCQLVLFGVDDVLECVVFVLERIDALGRIPGGLGGAESYFRPLAMWATSVHAS